MKPRIGVSACLLGETVRYDGSHRREPAVADVLARRADLAPVCPEMEAGLGVPREPIAFSEDGERLAGTMSGVDVTDRLRAAAKTLCADLMKQGLDGFVFKSRSPSCGIKGVPRGNRGLFARSLIDVFPGLPIADEEDLRDPSRLDEFWKNVSGR